MKKFSVYFFISTLSVMLRQFVLPNPFEEYGIVVSILLNYVLEPLFWMTTYTLVGIFYEKNSCPAIGSVLYFFFYATHVFLMMKMVQHNLGGWIIAICLIYVAIVVFINKLVNHVFRY